jgi:chromosome segregation ATPase
MKRYDMIRQTVMGEAWQDLEEEPDGEWIRYEDYEALQSRLDAQRASLRSTSSAQEQRLRDELTAVQHEFESVRLERVQLETLYAEARDETLALRMQVHDLNNALTTAILERDAARHEIHLYEVHAQQASQG